MQNLRILNSKEIKKILDLLKENFGFWGELDYTFLMNEKNRIFIISRDLAKIDLRRLRVNSMGLYFGEINKGEIRLSIEGAQLIARDCNKNIIELNEKESKDWLKGFDLPKEHPQKAFVILKFGEDILGCGRATGDTILNYVPKNRRLKVSD